MSKDVAKAMHIAMRFIGAVMFLIGFAFAMYFQSWWWLLAAPFLALSVPNPYDYFGDKR